MCIPVISFVFTCTKLILFTSGLFGNDPSTSILNLRAWRQLWRCRLTVWSRQYVVCASPTVLPLYAASHRYCDWPLQPFRRWHSARPYFLQLLWGPSLEDCWNHGIERNSQGIRALTRSHSLRRGDWGPPPLTHSLPLSAPSPSLSLSLSLSLSSLPLPLPLPLSLSVRCPCLAPPSPSFRSLPLSGRKCNLNYSA